MTVGILLKVFSENNIPNDCVLQSDSGWECSETDMDGVYYNKAENRIIFTQEENSFGGFYDKQGWELLEWKK